MTTIPVVKQQRLEIQMTPAVAPTISSEVPFGATKLELLMEQANQGNQGRPNETQKSLLEKMKK